MKPRGKRMLWRPGDGGEDNIKNDIRRQVVDLICLVQHRNKLRVLVNTVMDILFPRHTGNLLTN
jgi:hypothetical protein